MTLAIEIAASSPRDVDLVGVPVFASGPVPRSLGLSRARLGELGFEGKPGQALTLPSASGPSTVAIGLVELAKLTTGGLRTAAAALARAAGTQVRDDAGIPLLRRLARGHQLGVDVQQVHRLGAADVTRVGAQEAVQLRPAGHGRLERSGSSCRYPLAASAARSLRRASNIVL